MSKKSESESESYRAEAELASNLSHRLELEIASTEDEGIDKACVAQLATINLLTGIQSRHGYSIDTMLGMVRYYLEDMVRYDLEMAAADDVAEATTEKILNRLMKNVANKD